MFADGDGDGDDYPSDKGHYACFLASYSKLKLNGGEWAVLMPVTLC